MVMVPLWSIYYALKLKSIQYNGRNNVYFVQVNYIFDEDQLTDMFVLIEYSFLNNFLRITSIEEDF